MELDAVVRQAQDTDPRAGLRAVVALRRLAARLEALHVARAREEGLSWAAIAAELEVTRQSVHERYHRRGEQ